MSPSPVSSSPPLLIAQIGLNHNGDFERAVRLLETAAECGCDGVNFHKYPPPDRLGREGFAWMQRWCPELGATPQQAAEKLDLNLHAFQRLREAARGRVAFWGTPFDTPSLEFLDELDVDGFYIPAGCNTDFPLLKRMIALGRPALVSTGSCDGQEVEQIAGLLGGGDFTLMHGVACFPLPAEESHLQMIGWLGRFGRPVGYDDHEAGNLTGPVAAALGARILQKHVTLDRSLPGPAHAYAAEPGQLRQWAGAVRRISRAVSGPAVKRILPVELDNFDAERRSLVAAVDIPRDTILTEEMLESRAPLRGLTPRMLPELIGCRTLYHVQKGEPITFGLVEVE